MTAREFAYWLQGYFELTGSANLTAQQAETIRLHLALVFHHDIDPSYGGDPAEMQDIHDGTGGIPVTPQHLKDQGIRVRC